MLDDHSMSIVGHASVEAFFYEVVTEALERADVRATEPTEHYLVGLLGAFAKARITDEPLSLKLARCADDTAERVRALKEVGDTSLYVTGFFADSLQSQLVHADYYVSLGSAAYRQLAAHVPGSSVREVYEELSNKFPKFVDVLSDIRTQVNFASADVGTLYEAWLGTRSAWVEERLRELGMMVAEPDTDLLQ